LGWLHLLFYHVSKLAGLWIVYIRNRAVTSGERTGGYDYLVPAGIQNASYALGAICFLIVVIGAYRNTNRPMDPSSFD